MILGVRRRWMLGVSAVLCTAAACFPSFSGLSDGTDAAPIPTPDSGDGGGDEIGPVPDDGGAGFDVVVPDGDAALPNALNCLDAKNRLGATIDGVVTIDPDGLGPYKSFDVYCMDMATAQPKEWLTLVNTTDPNAGNAFASGSNVSTFKMGDPSTFTCSCPPDDVRAYTRVRLNVATSPIKIVTNDTKFSKTNRTNDQPNACEAAAGGGKCNFFGHPGYDFGVASSCVETPQTYAGRANVDLRGTVFHIALAEKGHLEGYQPFGQTSYVNDGSGLRKQAEVQGGGRCGWSFAGNSTDTLSIEHD
jgi:hypothetical protein